MSSLPIPQKYKDACTFSIMRDPVKATCGHTFERDFIQNWVRTNKTCPFDRKPITDQLIEQKKLKNKIDNFLKDHPEILAELKQEEEQWTAYQRSLANKAFRHLVPVTFGAASYLFFCTKICSTNLNAWQLVPMFSIGTLPLFLLHQYPELATLISSHVGGMTAYYFTGSFCFATSFATTMAFTGKFITRLADSVEEGRPIGTVLEEISKTLYDR